MTSRLGQNFLIDEAACLSILAALGDISDRTVVEIGPGRGALTDLLAPRCRRLIAIELDSDLAAALTTRFRAQPSVTLLQADVLAIDIASLFAPGGPVEGEQTPEGKQTVDVLGNLPYYITSDILLHLFRAAPHLRRAVIMVQREVADRLAASPGSRDFGLLSATAQLYARVERIFTLPPAAFTPPPKVDSTVLRLDFAPRFQELQVDPAGFDHFLKQCFAQKRKTLANNLRAAGYTTQAIASALPAAISPSARAESLSLEQLAAIYRSLPRHKS